MLFKMYMILIYFVILAGGCYTNLYQDDVDQYDKTPIQPVDSEPGYDYLSLQTTDKYDTAGTGMGEVDQNEISGIALSPSCENRLWGINDSGNGPYLFLFDTETAKKHCVYFLKNMENIDWEDLSNINLQGGKAGLLIADIGNNFLNRNVLTLYRFVEPACDCDQVNETGISPEVDQINFVYPEGTQDAEAVFTDNQSGDIYIITKNQTRSGVYQLPYPQDTETTDTLTYLGSLPFPFVVSADYFPETGLLVVKTYDQIFIWENPSGKPLSEVVFEVPDNAPYYPPEMQGESIAIGSEGYYTLSERVLFWDPVLYFYRKK